MKWTAQIDGASSKSPLSIVILLVSILRQFTADLRIGPTSSAEPSATLKFRYRASRSSTTFLNRQKHRHCRQLCPTKGPKRAKFVRHPLNTKRACKNLETVVDFATRRLLDSKFRPAEQGVSRIPIVVQHLLRTTSEMHGTSSKSRLGVASRMEK